MHRLTFIIISVLIISCSSSEVSIPENIIPKEKMVHILADIHIAEVTANYKSLGDTNKIEVKTLYLQIYNKHSITAEQYKESYQFYLDHPTLMNKMYDEVITELSRRQTEVQNN